MESPWRISNHTSTKVPARQPRRIDYADAQHALPEELDSFIGRQSELAALAPLLSPANPSGNGGGLVTIAGTGGIGKTRLALRLAHRLRAQQTWPHGVGWVWLRSAQESTLADHIAGSLDMQQSGSGDTHNALIAQLRDKQMLLVLDNCEHVLPSIRRFVFALLRAAPGITVLTTSRRSLGLQGEVLHQLAPLPTAAGHYRAGQRYDAADLFIARAQQVRPEFDGAAHYEEVVALCDEVEAVPLAVELLARRMQSFSLPEIRRRQRAFLNTPVAGSPVIADDDIDRASVSLRQVLDWSWDLMQDAPEQRLLLQRLSVFTGSFQLRDVEAVCSDEDLLPADGVWATLEALEHQSLVHRTDETPGGETRYRLLEPIRNYAEDTMSREQATDLRQRHLRWIDAEFTEAARGWLGPGEADVLARCRQLLTDFYSALEYCYQEFDTETAARLLNAAFEVRIPWVAGALPEMCHHYTELLDLLAWRNETRAIALSNLGYLETVRGIPTAIDRLDEAQSITDELGIELLQVATARAVAKCFMHGDASCVADMEHVYTVMRETAPDAPALQMVEMWWCICSDFYGEPEQADQLTQRHLRRTEELGAENALGWARWARAVYYLLHRRDDQRALAEADLLIAAGIQSAAGMDDRWIPTWWALVAAVRAAASGEHARAAEAAGIVAGMTATTGIRVDQLAQIYPLMQAGQERARRALGEEKYSELWHSCRDQAAVNYREGIDLLTHPVTLTKREMEVAELHARGHDNLTIAKRITIDRASVSTYLTRIRRKTGIRTPEELRIWLRLD